MRTSFGRGVGAAMSGVVMVGGMLALPALAGGTGAQRVPLIEPPLAGVCSVLSGGGGQDGFVVINQAGTRVSATVSLKGALPSDTYAVVLYDSSCNQIGSGVIDTNGQGNGNTQITAPAGGTGTYSVTGSETVDHFASPPVVLN